MKPGSVYRHEKRGTDYQIVGIAKLQNGGGHPLFDDAPLVVYRGDDGQLWARHEKEFTDGRFKEIENIIPSPKQVNDAKTVRGGWTKAQLAAWGVPWPPPKGWRHELREKWEAQNVS